MLDFEEDYLISLCVEYWNSFDKLNQLFDEAELTKEYGRGGLCIHRGFYCPSPVMDIMIGGCDRGYLVKKPRSSVPVDYVFLKADDKLRIVDHYWQRSENICEHYTREFIIDNNLESIGLTYNDCTWNPPRLSYICLCRYDSTGKMTKYLEMLPNHSWAVGRFEKKNIELYCEEYCYNEQTGLLESVLHGTKWNQYISENYYRFYHDETGRLLSYQYEMANGDYSPIFTVAKKKRRMI